MDIYKVKKIKRKTLVMLKYVFLCLVAFSSLFPFIWVILSSFKDNSEIYLNSFGLPNVWRVENYIRAFSSTTLLRGFRNSIIITACVLLLTIPFGAMAAYITSRMNKKSLLYSYFTLGIMIPGTALLIPTFIILKNMKLVYTLPGIILAYAAQQMPITVFMLHGFMKNIPMELEEAAIIDGSSRTGRFFRIILPLSKPGLATVLTLLFLNVWNDYLLDLIIGGKDNLKNLIVGIYYFRSEFIVDYGMTCAGLMFSIIPVAIVYFIFQEQVIAGMTEGAVKA